MSTSRRAAALIFICLALVGCSRTGGGARAFYFWRTHFALDDAEREVLRRENVQRLYIRLFDVTANAGEPRPAGQTRFTEPVLAGLEVVPVVYVANAAMQATRDPDALALKIWELVEATAKDAGFTFGELQLDCDWNEGTREAFFELCRRLRMLAAPRALSTTIRLHQVKYRERTGVPPADRGMLMFYNMGQLRADNDHSSIFNSEVAKRYTARLDDYPLPLDVALPLFSWGIHVRAGQVVGLIEKPDVGELDALPGLDRRAPGHYVATRSTLFQGNYLREGDSLHLESATPTTAREAAQLLAHDLHIRGPHAVAIFDLDSRNLDPHAPQELDPIFTAAP